MSQNDCYLSSKQKRGLIALLSEPTMEAAAEASGVSRRTMTRWLGDPAFISELRNAEQAAIDEAVRRLISLVHNSVALLGSIVEDAEQPISQRRMAAEAILDFMMKLRSTRDLETRIEELELFYVKDV